MLCLIGNTFSRVDAAKVHPFSRASVKMIFTLDLPCSDFDFPSAVLAGHYGPDAAEWGSGKG